MKLIDANVFIYAAGGPHVYRDPCKRLLSLAAGGELEANTNIEVLKEILHYYRTRRRVPYGREVMERTLAAFPDPLPVTVPTMVRAADIFERHQALQARDAVHAALVFEHGLEGIISADRGFDQIPGIQRFDPRDL